MQNKIHYHAGLYLRLSKDDDQAGESFSIGTQRSILVDYCEGHQYEVCKVYVDDGYSVRTPLREITSTGEIEQSFRLD